MRAHIVTGVSRGLGLAMARQLLANPSARVIGVARHAPANLAAEFGDRFRFVAADLSHPDEAAQLMPRLLAALGPGPFVSVDLINNAGVVTPIALAGQYPPQAVIDAIQINLVAPLLLANAFLAAAPALTQDARILNLSSGAAVKAYPGWGVYGASKAAIDHFSRHAAEEQAGRGARVAALYPGVVDTDMQADIRASDATQFPLKERFDALKADGALSRPDDAARRILRHLRCDAFGDEPVVDIRNLPFD
ncbi:SDR family NAD(P)-dependent oxidoreductase [Paludibacterium sp.]|uniref:SDR family NAD(P)-dependent oxidoreductase n=1 Tax=Paludibacterium sp. TaxID=1917523 RepID=UPI0025FF9F6D|nr:SDR family NAD(P)-dependent oxidoreductase [Paludibacterium sp.]